MELNKSTCDQCGSTDDHPKVHGFGGSTHHHDCLPAVQKAEMIASSPEVAQIITTCESGTKGAELRTFIAELHSEGN